MKKFICSSIFIFATFFSYAIQLPAENVFSDNKTSNDIVVIPTPNDLQRKDGYFTIDRTTTLVIKNPELLPVAELLADYLYRDTGITLAIAEFGQHKNSILLGIDEQLPSDTYVLDIEDIVNLQGHDYEAVAQAAATLVQLVKESGSRFSLPRLVIKDAPVHQYRAVLLDLARFWQPTEIIYETIDLLWFYKIKYLQLHLTDHQRFTFPLDEYPKLKTINKNDQREYYTKKELQALVEYAKNRGVTIIPEIELPGHSTALWNTYPEIFGNVDPQTGEPDQLYVVNIAKEEAYSAINGIIKQVSSIFYTSPYIHIGADEVSLRKIKEVPGYQDYVTKHGLKEAAKGNPQELFCHFINRLNKMVKALGKKTLVWEGFPNSGAGSVTVDKDITVMAWNTTYNPPQNLIENGYKIINATWVPWYIVGAMNFLPDNETAYNWNIGKWEHWQPNYPKIQLKDTTAVIGGQLTFWEQTHDQVIPLLRKKVPLISEKLWSPQSTAVMKNTEDIGRIDRKYQKIFRPVVIETSHLLRPKDHTFIDSATISLSSLANTKIRYTFSKDWNLADLRKEKQYTDTFQLKESGVVTAQAFDLDNNPVGYKVQEYFNKIMPAYRYKLYDSAPLKGWKTLPSSDTLKLVRKGYLGKMNSERLEHINRRLFSKVASGHIDTRLHDQYNPYLLELTGTLEIPKDRTYSLELQTYDGLAAIFLNGERIAKGENFKDQPEYFKIPLSKGQHEIFIKYYFKNIRNRLSIKYKDDTMQGYEPIENLAKVVKM